MILNLYYHHINKSKFSKRLECLSKFYFSTWKRPDHDVACEIAASTIRYGDGITSEVGMDLKEMKAKHVALFTDSNLMKTPTITKVLESFDREDIIPHLYSDVRVEPNDISFKHAIEYLKNSNEKIDAIVAVGGGSVIDTAKAANLYYSYPPNDFYDYVNAPVGLGKPIPGNLLPLIAIPTTAGTGSETTGIAVFDDTEKKSKTGIAHRRLKPTLGLVDPLNMLTMPKEVTRNAGIDVLCHAIESYTALPYTKRPYPETPLHRPAYQGSNPISDVWSLQALRMGIKYIHRAVNDPEDYEARSNLALASVYAGIGFGNAGCHLCHGMSYPVASQVKDYIPSGYNTDHPLIPHGHSVIVNAPAVFAFTGPACPIRHLECAEILSNGKRSYLGKVGKEEAGRVLASELISLMDVLDIPLGLRYVGYTTDDISNLVQGTLPQHRVTKLSPRPVEAEDLELLFENAMDYDS